ncbi:MAG TPA: Ger(x)C family spore germination protein [Ruminiclostridium sp.]|nr:Ger(x)C family spore germination protein [Ruminiclostridium sp.]
MEAYEAIQKKTSRSLFMSHLTVLIIGENLARSGVAESLDFFSRHRESRISKDVVFTKDLNGLLSVDGGLERLLSETLREELTYNSHFDTSLREFLTMLTEEGTDPLGVAFSPENLSEESASSDSDNNSLQKSGGITGTALFHKDKLVGWLDNKESKAIYLLKGKAKQGNFSIEIPDKFGGGKIGGFFRIQGTKIDPLIRNNKLEFDIKLKSQLIVFESNSKLDLSDHKSVHYLEGEESKYLKEKSEATLKKIQSEYGADILGLGKQLYNKYPKLWRNKYEQIWENEYPKVKINLVVDTSIPRTGLDTKSPTLPDKDFVKVGN